MKDSVASHLVRPPDGPPARSAFGIGFVTPLALGSMLNPINSTAISTALVLIAAEFHSSVAQTGLMVAALYLSSAISQPVMGRMADIIGARRIFLLSLVIVAAASLVGTFAASLLALLVARVLLGVGTSGAYPATMRIFRLQSDKYGTEPPRGALSVLAFSAAATAIFGPVMGGILSDLFGWRAIFAVNLPLLLIIAILMARSVPHYDEGEKMPWRMVVNELDVPGILLFSAVMSSLMLFLLGSGVLRWVALAFIAIALFALVAHSLRRPQPFLDVRLLVRNRALSLTYLRHACIQTIVYAFFFGFPQWLQASAGYTPTEAGLITIPMYICSAASALAGGRMKSLRLSFTICTASALAGSLLLLFADHQSPTWFIAGVAVLFGVPTGLTATASQAAVYLQSTTRDIGTSSGLLRTAQYLGAMVSTGMLSLAFGHRASDAGLHTLAIAAALFSAVLLVAALFDRTLPEQVAA